MRRRPRPHPHLKPSPEEASRCHPDRPPQSPPYAPSSHSRSVSEVIGGIGAIGAGAAFAQGPPLTVPQPSQAATVSQTVGLTEITVTYHRPRVQGREIWGKVVPYGEVWRAGANENTTIAFSTPVEVEGHVLPAGSYGFHTLPSAGAWQLIFSSVDTNWGSFSYDEKEDVLRVEVTPEAAPHEEALAYTFDDATARETTAGAALGEAPRAGSDQGRHARSRLPEPEARAARPAAVLLAAVEPGGDGRCSPAVSTSTTP